MMTLTLILMSATMKLALAVTKNAAIMLINMQQFDVQVVSFPLDTTNDETGYTLYDVRLVGGATDNEGRVEMCRDGRWMAICSDGWTEQDAGQLCKEFGFASIGRFMTIIIIVAFIIMPFHLPFCAGAEVRVFNPRRVPTISCTISDSGELICNKRDDGITDLGIRCIRREVLDLTLNDSTTAKQPSIRYKHGTTQCIQLQWTHLRTSCQWQ